ncbi:S-layer homology domain-containing protein [Sporosarcina sp. G11-34]|uniref:S-layer homology domain-containing protein n=1 Tax=Sporosarcina sp. G11-34 TaxID=2849605 RepID=UPI0022A8E71B|nr:S-layer homology domain-containing protein [Sporosarcina sp. G11-34]MCZ2257847.1 S-layer homology domain-containing protein [Sporosarcina sp. G11-34]
MIKSMMKFRILFVFALIFQLVAIPLQSLANGSTALTETDQVDYLALGDSLAYGINSDGLPGQAYSDFLALTMQSTNSLKSFNKGFSVPGYKTTDVLKDLQENVTKAVHGQGNDGETAELYASIKAAEVITISVGANDALGGIVFDPDTGIPVLDTAQVMAKIQQVGVNYHQIMAGIYALNPDVQVYVMGYFNPFPHRAEALQPQFKQLVDGLNTAIQAGITGTSAVFVPTAEKIAENYDAYLPNPENIHLSEAGYQAVAGLFARALLGNNPTPPAIFPDIENNRFKQFIEQSVALGLIAGHSDGTFKPDDELNRVQAAAIIVRALKLKSDVAAPFPDIRNYSKGTQAEIAAAYKFGITKGTSDGTFKPSEPVTRAQLALMINRTYTIVTGQPYVAAEVAPFSDIGSYDAVTQNAISMLFDFEIAHGSDGKFMPDDSTTRGQAAKIFVTTTLVFQQFQ